MLQGLLGLKWGGKAVFMTIASIFSCLFVCHLHAISCSCPLLSTSLWSLPSSWSLVLDHLFAMVPAFVFNWSTLSTFLLLLKHRLPQNKRPSHSFSAMADITFLNQLGWMRFWHPGLLHASKGSSFLGHLPLRPVLNSYDFSQYSCRILHD